MLAVKSAVEDLAAIVVGHQCTTGGSPQRLSLVGKAGTDAVARRYQIQRPAVDWDFEDSSGKPRAVDDRFIVTSQQSGAVAQLGYVQRAEIVFEKYPRLVICETANGKRLTTYLRKREVHRVLITILHAGAHQWTATRQEGGKGRGVIVRLPAVQRIPLNRLNRCIGEP